MVIIKGFIKFSELQLFVQGELVSFGGEKEAEAAKRFQLDLVQVSFSPEDVVVEEVTAEMAKIKIKR